MKALVIDKSLKEDYRMTLDLITKINSTGNYKVITKMCYDLAVQVHIINLIRWFGSYRNSGQYNKDTYFSAITFIKETKIKQDQILELGKEFCPPEEALKELI